MLEGEIIKYYRRKRKMNQEDLCQGICSISHLSKIEVGSTKFSDELLPLLAERLGINIKEKVKQYNQLKMSLEKWRQAILFQKKEEISRFKKSIESEELLGIPSMFLNYRFLLSRYFLYEGELDHAHKTITAIEKESFRLSSSERNYLQYLYGIYYYYSGLYNDSIVALESIEVNHDEAGVYYYHLAMSYHAINSTVKSYHMAAEALKVFVKDLNLSRIVDAEMLMLIQLSITEPFDFHYIVKKYQRLIEICEASQDDERKGKLWLNLAFEYSRRGYYIEASELYQEVMELAKGNDKLYIASLEKYVLACLKGKLLPEKELTRLCMHGQRISKNINDTYYSISFRLHILSIGNDEAKYYQYVEDQLIPYFRKTGYRLMVEQYEKKLFHYFLRQKRNEDALAIARQIIDSKTFYNRDL